MSPADSGSAPVAMTEHAPTISKPKRLAEPAIQLAVIGTGYVGLVSGACFAAAGIRTICVDLDRAKLAKLEKGETPIHEPGLSAILKKAIRKGTIRFTDDIAAAVRDADGIIIAVGTPTDHATGRADVSFVLAAARQFAPHLKPNAFVIAKSTVPVGTNRAIARAIREAAPEARFHTVSNPEFLREGQAVNDFMHPDRIVVGVDSAAAESFMCALYKPFGSVALHVVGVETAEIVKYASNAFLATKIAFINEISDLCEKAGADVREVAEGMGLDPRIAPAFLKPGPGYGGSCFPKDTLALVATGEDLDVPQTIVTAVAAANDRRKRAMAGRIDRALSGLSGRRIALLGLAFKPGTDDVRDSPAIDLIRDLRAAGATVTAHDPEASDHPGFAGIARAASPLEAIQGADAIVLVTEWPLYTTTPMWEALRRMRGNLIVDLRNALDGSEMRRIGFRYLGIGLGADSPASPITN